ncbi:hypothetical protein [Modicisalibacter tunisiensis]|uniref:Tetratricopeptide repeat protein n=1 Tax=Modicisalibacter tunisiensis TaxID=390637 RepID=A0ABS7WVP2_9GAMM|nr:hypothetical protein [Modicisalibacter tunisiensis]MBZ9566656.1 hypothetical protein [Modicisalibacter tunisiensis]
MISSLGRWWRNRLRPTTPLSQSTMETTPTESTAQPGEWVAYDEDLLERARTQWQFGDWESLASLQRDTLQHHPDRAKLALLAAAGLQQSGNSEQARQLVRLATQWGASKKLIAQVLIAGVHNTLGRAAAINGSQQRALNHFEKAVANVNTQGDTRLLIQARTRNELERLNIAIEPQVLSRVGQRFVSPLHYQVPHTTIQDTSKPVQR